MKTYILDKTTKETLKEYDELLHLQVGDGIIINGKDYEVKNRVFHADGGVMAIVVSHI